MHDHVHSHGPGHTHHHGGHGVDRTANRRRLTVVLLLVVVYMVAEVIGGIASNSLALLADAGHMLSDAGALAISLFAIWLATRPAPARLSFGFYRTEILAALLNGATLVAVSIFIFVEAVERFRAPPVVSGPLMLWVASGGLVVNLLSLWILHGGRNASLNVRGAWLHVMTDALSSVGAMAAATAIAIWGWTWVDPAVSILIGVLVMVSSWNLLRETVAVLMESAPGNVDVDAVRNAMLAINHVQSVHDLHVWSITSGMVALSAHVETRDDRDSQEVLSALRDMLHTQFDIDHVTIQLEHKGFCETPQHA